MLRYRFVNHTADIEFIAYGKDLNEVFRNALLALFDTIAYRSKLYSAKSESTTISISAEGTDKESLLWGTLQKALSVCDARGVFAYDVSTLIIRNRVAKLQLRTKLIARDKCQKCAKFDVKGVSKYDMIIERGANVLKAQVVVDV
ncbi:MAG: archease [Candidatus Micrarchaeia archaeon]